jgi:hypothetical protein
MNNPRYDAGAVHLDGEIYIFCGAVVGAFDASGKSEVYSIDENVWTNLSDCPIASYSVNAVAANHQIYLIGFNFTDVF